MEKLAVLMAAIISVTRSQEAHVSMYKNDLGLCVIAGDPYLYSFDNKAYEYQGAGCHVLSAPGPFLLNASWSISGMFTPAASSNRTYMSKAFIEFHGHHIQQHMHKLLIVDGQTKTPPVTLTVGISSLEIVEHGPFLNYTLEPAGVKAAFDLRNPWCRHEGVINVTSSSLAGTLIGLCADYNNNPDDDFVPQGSTQVVNDVDIFGNSWMSSTHCISVPISAPQF